MHGMESREFRKSRRSDGGSNCVEVAAEVAGRAVRVRDSKDRTGPVLEFTDAQWRAFLTDMKSV